MHVTYICIADSWNDDDVCRSHEVSGESAESAAQCAAFEVADPSVRK